jgi:endonuclease/exonuclease/phosphatase family metal-dependent hydrolase
MRLFIVLVLFLFIIIAMAYTHKTGGTETFKLNSEFRSKNRDGVIEKFYNDNANLLSGSAKPANALRIATLNIHGSRSMNVLDTPEESVNCVFDFMDKHKIDILGLEEYNSKYANLFDTLIKGRGLFSTPLRGWSFMNLIISRFQLDNIKTISLPGGDHRSLVVANVMNSDYEWRIGLTHLSILPRNYNAPNSESYKESVAATIERHREQLNVIEQNPTDILMGDFNFNRTEPEYSWMHDAGWCDHSTNVPTTPFGTTVDFVWTRHNVSKSVYVCAFMQSDHRAVVADIIV